VIATCPTFERLQHRLGGGRPLAALLMITLATLVLVLPPAVVASSTDCNPDLDPVRCGWQRHRFRRTRAVPWSDLLAGYYELIREWNAAEKHAFGSAMLSDHLEMLPMSMTPIGPKTGGDHIS
jgi:hypothetical protein